MFHAFLAWLHFDENPIPWTYVFVMIPLELIAVVRFVHYHPIIVATKDDEREMDMIGHCVSAFFWPIAIVWLTLYGFCHVFVWCVRTFWPTRIPEQKTENTIRTEPSPRILQSLEPLSPEAVNELLEE